MSKRLLLFVTLFSILVVSLAHAGFEEGKAAYDKGDYVKDYEDLAEQGFAGAQYHLGYMYDKGQGVAPDKVVAHKWLILSAARAAGRQHEYFARIRDAVASTMSPGEIAEAQYLAHKWRPMQMR